MMCGRCVGGVWVGCRSYVSDMWAMCWLCVDNVWAVRGLVCVVYGRRVGGVCVCGRFVGGIWAGSGCQREGITWWWHVVVARGCDT